MFRVGILLGLAFAEICLCPTSDLSVSSDYWSSSEEIMFCSPEICDRQSTVKFTTTTQKLTTTCVAVPTVEFKSDTTFSSTSEPEVCENFFLTFLL